MRKLTHSPDSVRNEERRISKLVPVLAGAVALGLTLGVPVKSDAQQPSRAQLCSASVERGRMPSYTSTTRTSRLMRTPLLEASRYLQISMPNAYMDQVGQAAAARPETERPAFIADIMQKNVSAALTALGSNRSAAFECAAPAPSSAAPVSPAPQPAAPASTAPPAPQPAPSGEQPAQPPAQDGGTDQPAQRRRVIQPGAPTAPGSKAAPAPKKQNDSATATQAPMPPIRKGGKGTDAEPYVIEVPVPSKRAAGAELYREKFSYTYSGAEVSEKIYISLRFVAASGTTVTSKNQLIGQITPLASLFMRDALRAKNINDAPSSGSLSSSIGMIVGHAKKESADVRTYAADS